MDRRVDRAEFKGPSGRAGGPKRKKEEEKSI